MNTLRDKVIEQLVQNDIDTMIKNAENGDFWYLSEVLKTRTPYKDWSEEDLLDELNDLNELKERGDKKL
jgi:DNA polymerase III delta prime subunit